MAYMDKHMAVHRPAGESTFFEQQTEQARLQLDESSERLLRFSRSHRIVAAAQERDLALQRLSELEAGARQTAIEVAETRQRAKQLEEQLSRLPERTITQVRTADNPDLLKSLKASLLDLRFKRSQLLTKFESSHRLVQEVDQQIAQAEAAIAAESSSPVRDETTDKNPNHEWAKSELQRAQVQLHGLEARQAAALAQVTSWKKIAEELGEDAIVQHNLLSRQKAAEDSYLLYVKKREEARMNDALDERGIVNVAIAEQPGAPALPVYSQWTVLALGLMTAGVSGIGAAFAADYLDSTFRDPDDVVAFLHAPVLASLPRRERRKLPA
jgi:uncharacterized protein involved in exopolysaccharide biosynthesis